MIVAGFEWDAGNRAKCRKHGVTLGEIEELFRRTVMVLPDVAHSMSEERFRAIGRTAAGRHVFVVFTVRQREDGQLIRPISARFMHRREIERYAQENPELRD